MTTVKLAYPKTIFRKQSNYILFKFFVFYIFRLVKLKVSSTNKQTFNKNDLLSNLEYLQWLQLLKEIKLAVSRKFRKTIKLSNMGETALKSHVNRHESCKL